MASALFGRMSFQIKTWLLVLVLVSFSLLVIFRYQVLVNNIVNLGLQENSQTMLGGYKSELKNMVDVMASTLAEASKGATNQNQVHQIFERLVKNARFFPDKSGYFFIYKKGGTVFVHPTQPNLEGKNLINLKDPKGTMVIKDLNTVAEHGGGYVTYIWNKPGEGLKPKLSYAKMIPGEPYWIGTGVYIGNIEKKNEQILNSVHARTNAFLIGLYALLGLVLVLVIAPLAFLLIRGIVKPIRELTVVADEFSRGKIDLEMPYTSRTDEIGKLANALDRLGRSVKVALSRMKR